jgi:hypothetical protein
MDKIISERFVKLSSRLPFPEDIQLGDDISVIIKGKSYIANCVKTEDFDLQDGIINRVFILKWAGE